MELGVASSIKTVHLMAEASIHGEINDWLKENPGVDVIDIKFATSANAENWSTDVLIIYRKNS